MKTILIPLIFFSTIFLAAPLLRPVKYINHDISRSEEKLLYPALVDQFYLQNGNKLVWMRRGADGFLLRRRIILFIDSAFYGGQISKKFHEAALNSYSELIVRDTDSLMMVDRIFTDAAIAVCKDLYQAFEQKPWVGYDQLSAKYAEADNNYLLQRLSTISTQCDLLDLFQSLVPAKAEYAALQKEYSGQLEKNSKDSAKSVQLAMNFYRWIHHFHFDRFIVINLAEARLRYYENDSVVLNMKTVVGKPSTPTPRFATIADQVILYPYWYVPPSIIFNEYLPRIKKNPSWIDANNMQVVDGSGKIMNHLAMNWSSFHNGYFPYSIRQSTGCDNALGVIKFNIVTPYGVYLHDTNNKTAFLSGSRYYSHGCIRIEEPLELGNKFLAGKLDTVYLQSCFKEMKPKFIDLEKPVPVFSVYMPVSVDAAGKIRYMKDIYKLLD